MTAVDCHTALDKKPRDDVATNTAEVGCEINNPGKLSDLHQTLSILVAQDLGSQHR
jgi:hypothetical protein